MTLLLNLWRRFLTWIRGEAPKSLPPIVYVDRDGVGWTRHPDWLNGTHPDEGQHDSWKRDLRIFLWRAAHGLPDTPGSLNLKVLGLEDRYETVPFLMPVGQQLAEASRRLGFYQLAKAAMPEILDEDLQAVYARHELAVKAEAERMFAHNTKTLGTWDPVRMGGEFRFETVDQTVEMLTLGPFDGKPDNAPLKPLDLSQTSVSPDRFTAVRPRSA